MSQQCPTTIARMGIDIGKSNANTLGTGIFPPE